MILLSAILFALAAIYSGNYMYYLAYFGIDIILFAIYASRYSEDPIMRPLPVVSYFIFEILTESNYLNYVLVKTSVLLRIIGKAVIFLCALEILRCIFLRNANRFSKDRWVQYCISAVSIVIAKNFMITIQMMNNHEYYYRALEFWGCFCFLTASALIVLPDFLRLNRKRVRIRVICFACTLIMSGVGIAGFFHYSMREVIPALISMVAFQFTFDASVVFLAIGVFISFVREVARKGLVGASRFVYEDQLEEIIESQISQGKYKPIGYGNSDFYREYVDSQVVYRADEAMRIKEIQKDLSEIRRAIDMISQKSGSDKVVSLEHKKILRKLCIRQYELLEELNDISGVEINIVE